MQEIKGDREQFAGVPVSKRVRAQSEGAANGARNVRTIRLFCILRTQSGAGVFGGGRRCIRHRVESAAVVNRVQGIQIHGPHIGVMNTKRAI